MPGRNHRPHVVGRKPPKPRRSKVRYIEGSRAAEMMSVPERARRREEMAWSGISVDLWADQELLAMRRDDTITVPEYTGEVWWFVLDVNGLARAITADTLLFDRPFERTFPFRMVIPHKRENWDENVEAVVALDRLKQLRGKDREKKPPPESSLAEAA
jgi:hypothetical protein